MTTQAKDPRPVWARPLLIVVVLVGAAIFLASQGGESADRDTDDVPSRIVGRFIRWEPVDDARGYAYFEVTNRGSTAAVATCTVTVRNDFGNFGFDIMSGETIAAGETESFRMALDVDEGALLVDEGEVKDC